MLPGLTIVLGGAASGKSAFAEDLVISDGRPKSYIATAQAFDAEMEAKIARHRESRGAGWHTIEAPTMPGPAIKSLTAGDIALLDCATMWLSNVMLADTDLDQAQASLLADLESATAGLVVVSNDVGGGIVPENALARRFRDAQGRLNTGLAARADLVVVVIAGLPMVLKGQLP